MFIFAVAVELMTPEDVSVLLDSFAPELTGAKVIINNTIITIVVASFLCWLIVFVTGFVRWNMLY